LKLLYVMRQIWGGGASRRFWEIHKRLAKRGYDVTLLGLFKNPETDSLTEYGGIQIYPIKTILPYSDYVFYMKAPSIIKAIHKNFDLIHDDFSPTGCYSFLWHDKSVVTIHETFGRYALEKYSAAGLIPFINEKLYKRTSYKKFISCAPSVKESLKKLGIHSTLIPAGADAELFNHTEKKSNNPVIIIMVSRLAKGKGLDLFIEVARLLSSRYTNKNIKFMLIGDGPLMPYLERKIGTLKLNIELISQLDDDELANALKNSSIYLHTSLQEGFGLSICEAMASGLPVVAFDVLGVRDIVNPKTGILVPPTDIKKTVDALEMLLEDENMRNKLGQNARDLVVNKYTWEKSANLMDQVYNSL